VAPGGFGLVSDPTPPDAPLQNSVGTQKETRARHKRLRIRPELFHVWITSDVVMREQKKSSSHHRWVG